MADPIHPACRRHRRRALQETSGRRPVSGPVRACARAHPRGRRPEPHKMHTYARAHPCAREAGC